MWALADYSVGAFVSSAWRGIDALARLATRPMARERFARVARCIAYMLVAAGAFTLVQSVPRAGAAAPPSSAVLAARRFIESIEQPGGL